MKPTRNRFGSTTLVCLVIANMIGAGVYTTSGYTMAALHTPARVLLAWAIGGLIALAGARSYGMLIRAMPESGGEYLFLSRAAHPFLGFIAGWISLIAGFTGSIAFAATALENYLHPFAPALPEDALAISIIVIAGLSHGIRPRWGAGIQNGLVIGKVVLLVGFIIAAINLMDWHYHPPLMPETPLSTTPALLGAFASSLMWISLSYLGFNAAVYIAEESHQPHRQVSRALLIGTSLVVCLYLLLNAIFVYAPHPEEIAGQAAVAAIAAEALAGPRLAACIRGIIAISLFTSVTAMMLAAPRVYAKMAADGFLPSALQTSSGHPRAATWAQAAGAIIVVHFSELQGLLSYLGLTLSLCAAMSVACLFLPRIRKAIPISWHHLAPLFYLVSTLVIAAMMIANEPKQITATLITFAAGALLYFLPKRTVK